ncbi:MAG TPA: DUF1902 domain-containing protein [Thermoanaerobaculia bacterium]|nr:DUF1902 domain-containing protein [Thermoanaerobaculia bacterium]
MGCRLGGDSSWLNHLLPPHARGTLHLMGAIVYRVHADWDPGAKVWVATSDDVPGLATEAPTVEALAEKLRIMIPELLEASQLLSGDQRDLLRVDKPPAGEGPPDAGVSSSEAGRTASVLDSRW